MKQDFTIWRNQILQNPRDISPLKFGISQDEVIEIFGNPDAVSTMRSDGKPLILKYHDIELHFDRKAPHGLCLIYSDDDIELSITAEQEETLQPITNTEPVDNEFFLRDGAVYFSGLYENGLLKEVAPKDFCCWHYWGKSSAACFLGGIRLRGADPASFRVLNYAYAMDKTAVYTTSGRVSDAELAAFQVLDNGQNDSGAPQGYAKDSRQVYFHNGDGKVKVIKGAEVSSFRSLGDTYFARDEKRIYAYGKQLPKAELTSWELLGHWYSRDARRVYYLNREIKGADRDSFVVCTPLDAAPLADHLADNGQNDSGAPQGYAKDSRQVYFHNGDGKVKVIKGAEVSSFRSLGDTYFARDEKRIYAYGKQLPKAELTSWELLGHWYSRDARRVYYLNREIKGADRDSFVVCTPLDAAPLADHLARDKDHFYQNDEMIEETLWLERLHEMTQEP